MDNVLKSIDLLSSDYSLVKKEASSRQIKTRPESFASISEHFFNYLKTKIADAKNLEKGSKYSNLAATLDKKLTVLSLDGLANSFVDDRAIKLRNRMYNNFINNVYNLYAELKKEKDIVKEESADVNSARNVDLSFTDSDEFLKSQEKDMGLDSTIEPTSQDLNNVGVSSSMPATEGEQSSIKNDAATKFDINVKEDAKSLDIGPSMNLVQSEDTSFTSSNNFLEQQEKNMQIGPTIEPTSQDLNNVSVSSSMPATEGEQSSIENDAATKFDMNAKEDAKTNDSTIPEYKIITDNDINYNNSQKFENSSKEVSDNPNELGKNIRLDDILPVPEREETKSLENASEIKNDDVKEFSFVPDEKSNIDLNNDSESKETKNNDLKFDFSQATPSDINYIIDNKDTSKDDLKALKDRIEVLRKQKADNDKTLAAAKEQAEKKSQLVDKRREDVASKKDLYMQHLNKLRELAMALDEDNKRAEKDIQEFNSQASAYDEEAALLTKQADEYDSARSEIDDIIEFNNYDDNKTESSLKVA